MAHHPRLVPLSASLPTAGPLTTNLCLELCFCKHEQLGVQQHTCNKDQMYMCNTAFHAHTAMYNTCVVCFAPLAELL